MTSVSHKSLAVWQKVKTLGTVLTIDCGAGRMLYDTPWAIYGTGEKEVVAIGKGVVLFFHRKGKSHIMVQFYMDNVETKPSFLFALEFRPSEIEALSTVFAEVSRRADELISTENNLREGER